MRPADEALAQRSETVAVLDQPLLRVSLQNARADASRYEAGIAFDIGNDLEQLALRGTLHIAMPPPLQ